MHTTWKHLAIQNENELKDLKRLKKIHSARTRGSLIAMIGFALGAVVSFALGGWFLLLTFQEGLFLWYQGIGVATVMFLLSACFIFGVRMFLKERQLDILRNYFLNPVSFVFVEGEITSGSYSSGGSGNRASAKMIAKGVVNFESKKFHSIDFFSPDIWPFTTPDEDAQIQEGDDWYDLKGKRVYLPVKAMFLINKSNPTHAVLIAIDKGLIDDAVNRMEK